MFESGIIRAAYAPRAMMVKSYLVHKWQGAAIQKPMESGRHVRERDIQAAHVLRAMMVKSFLVLHKWQGG